MHIDEQCEHGCECAPTTVDQHVFDDVLTPDQFQRLIDGKFARAKQYIEARIRVLDLED